MGEKSRKHPPLQFPIQSSLRCCSLVPALPLRWGQEVGQWAIEVHYYLHFCQEKKSIPSTPLRPLTNNYVII